MDTPYLWEANLYHFYIKVYNRLIQVLPHPIMIKDGIQQEETPAHDAIREALINVSISVIKVGIRCKEHLAAIKFIIYFFSIYVHHCTLIIKLSITHQTEMTEKYHKSNCHKWV